MCSLMTHWKDGMGTAQACRTPVLAPNPNAYVIDNDFASVPTCLFNLPNLFS